MACFVVSESCYFMCLCIFLIADILNEQPMSVVEYFNGNVRSESLTIEEFHIFSIRETSV